MPLPNCLATARPHALIFCLVLLIAGCSPTPESNVLGYLLARQLGTTGPMPIHATGSITGRVLDPAGRPLAEATALVARRDGTPFAATTDAQGRYTLRDVPVGQYVPAAVAPGYEETAAADLLGVPRLVTVQTGDVAPAPDLVLEPHLSAPLPAPFPAAVDLRPTASYTATSPFPAGATADVRAFAFTRAGAVVDTLRLYLPAQRPPDRKLPLLYMVYPTQVDAWESVSVGFAAAGYAFLAISPIAARAVDIDAHAQDARVGLALARRGDLDPTISPDDVIVLGGSFSSPILHRLLRDETASVAAWITVGGISNALSGAADFYAGRIELPAEYEFAIPALGPPNLYPLPLLRYSPVYTAAQLPPTLIIHTAADRVTPIDQAYQLEAALQAAGVPVETYYYEDVSHYLQIGENLTDAGKQMYELVIDFARRHQALDPMP